MDPSGEQAELPDVSGDIVEQVDTVFFSDPGNGGDGDSGDDMKSTVRRQMASPAQAMKVE
jgi:hypothetical protein